MGLFLGSNDSESKPPLENPVSSKSEIKRTNLRSQSEAATQRLGRELMENGIQTDGVFGKIAAQIQRYQTMSDSEFETEVALLSTLRNSDRYISSYLLFTAWGEKNPHAALEYLERDETLTGGNRDHAKRVVYKSWTAQNPDLVIENLENNSDLNEGNRALRYDIATISNEWMKRDREAAFDWLKNLDSEYKGRAISQFFSVLAQENMPEAMEKLNQLEGNTYNEAVKEIAEYWGETMDWKVIESQISALPESTQEIAKREALTHYSRENPYEATAVISEMDMPDDEKYRLIKAVSDKIGSDNPSGTLDWALSNVGEKYQSFIADRVFRPWSKQSPTEAANWLISQPDDKVTRRMYNKIQQNESIPETVKNNLKAHFGDTK